MLPNRLLTLPLLTCGQGSKRDKTKQHFKSCPQKLTFRVCVYTHIYALLLNAPRKIPAFHSNLSSFLNTWTIKMKAVDHFTALEPSIFRKVCRVKPETHSSPRFFSPLSFFKACLRVWFGGVICLLISTLNCQEAQ